MSERARLTRAHDELRHAIQRGHVPSWLVDAVSTTLDEVIERMAGGTADPGGLLSRAETLLDLLASYRATGPAMSGGR